MGTAVWRKIVLPERIQKIIAARGVCSRRAAEELILAGRVTCNGSVCQLGDRAEDGRDMICLDGKPLPSRQNNVYIMLNKPRGFVTTMSDEKGRKTVADLVSGCPERVYPVGRLDMDSEGLLLLTNDGEFANQLMHPSHQINKTYRVLVSGYSDEGFSRLMQPITLDGYALSRPDVKLRKRNPEFPDRAELLITIHEGRNRQVRRMCEIAGMQVLRLIRIQEGNLQLGDLSKGAWRFLTQQEVFDLKNS